MAFRLALITAFLALAGSTAALAGDEGASAPATTAEPQLAASAEALTPEEKAEKEARKACKIEICDVLATKDPGGSDTSCDIVKTWREAAITNMLGGKFDWPWGKAVCQSKLVVKREVLAKAMSEASYEAVMPTQKFSCTLAQKKESKPYVVDVSIAPKVAFESGKAVTASLNWGKASGPMLVYAVIYAGTSLDNATNTLDPRWCAWWTSSRARNAPRLGTSVPTHVNAIQRTDAVLPAHPETESTAR
jgi:hypothetical protein